MTGRQSLQEAALLPSIDQATPEMQKSREHTVSSKGSLLHEPRITIALRKPASIFLRKRLKLLFATELKFQARCKY